MKHLYGLLLLLALLTAACGRQPKSAAVVQQARAANDSTIYGLICDGSNDTIVIFLNNPYDGADPDTLNILEASKAHRVFGSLRVGDKVALLRDTADTTHASIVIVEEDLLGQWCYRVKPTLKRKAAMDGQTTAQTIGQLPDSVRKLLEVELEYGFQLKIDSMATPIGRRSRASADEESPVEYPRAKRYTQWYILNGRLLLAETRMDSIGNNVTLSVDTAEFVTLTPDTLVLRFKDEEKGFYRKRENAS